MSKKEKFYRIAKLDYDHQARIYGYKYIVQELIRIDDRRILYNGISMFCKKRKEAEEWAKSHITRRKRMEGGEI